jgi:hypothetical protein
MDGCPFFSSAYFVLFRIHQLSSLSLLFLIAAVDFVPSGRALFKTFHFLLTFWYCLFDLPYHSSLSRRRVEVFVIQKAERFFSHQQH